jgi:hypothetical protein
MVGFAGEATLDSILARTPVPSEFDLLSIDVDGNDYHIWRALHRYRPRVVIVEFNSTIPNDMEFVQPADPTVNQGCSLLSLTKLATEKGYELAAVTGFNAFFVREDVFGALGISDNSLDAIRTDRTSETRVFQLYDGTLVWDGCLRQLWADVPIRPERMQVIPRFLRFYPGSQNSRVRRGARRAFLALRRRF